MSDPILSLRSTENWQLVYNETATAGRRGPAVYIPIAAFDIPILLSSPILVIEAENLDVKPWWWLGCRLQQVLQVGIVPDRALGQFVNVPVNRPRLFRFPRMTADYSLRVEVPPWFEKLKISIFEYTGPIGDSTERLVQDQADLIRIDLTRIETKIDQL